MLARNAIDIIMSRAAASLTREEALVLLNAVQNYVCARLTPISRIQPDPILKTEDGVLNYIANESVVDDDGNPVGDVYAIRRVYRDGCDIWTPDERLYSGDQGEQVEIGVGIVRSISALANDCKIIWPRRSPPRESDSLWRCEAYRWPTQLLTEQVPLSVPDEAVLPLLVMGVFEYAELQEYGRSDFPSQRFKDALTDFDNKHASEIFQPGVQTNNQVPYRSC